jgi:hypothetical protein
VDRGPLRHLITYCRPSLSDTDIPHCTTLHKEVLAHAKVVQQRVKEELKVCAYRVSSVPVHKSPLEYSWQGLITWTSKTGDPFLSITGHYITATPDRLNAWELKTQQLAFAPFEGHHSRSNMAKVIVCTLNHYGICEKVSKLNKLVNWCLFVPPEVWTAVVCTHTTFSPEGLSKPALGHGHCFWPCDRLGFSMHVHTSFTFIDTGIFAGWLVHS